MIAGERQSHCDRCFKPAATLDLCVLTQRRGFGSDFAHDVYQVRSPWVCAGWLCLRCALVVRARGIRDRFVWRSIVGARDAITFGGWTRKRDPLEQRKPGTIYALFVAKRWQCKTLRGQRMRPPSAFEDLDLAFSAEDSW